MLVYHVGFDIIKNPDVHYGRKNADFGQGFYLTDDKEFSYRWAKEKSGADTILNEYELKLTGLHVHEFTRGEEWFNYIYGNRHLKPDVLNADIVIGPIANDIIYDVLGITTSGFLPKDNAMKLFMIGPEYKQIVIKSEKALSKLSWLDSKVLTSSELADYHKQMEIEEAEFQELFAKEMEKIVMN